MEFQQINENKFENAMATIELVKPIDTTPTIGNMCFDKQAELKQFLKEASNLV